MKKNKSSKLAVRLEPREKKLLDYFATRLGMSSSALVRNQIKSLLQQLEEKVEDEKYLNIAKLQVMAGPSYSQEELQELFEIK